VPRGSVFYSGVEELIASDSSLFSSARSVEDLAKGANEDLTIDIDDWSSICDESQEITNDATQPQIVSVFHDQLQDAIGDLVINVNSLLFLSTKDSGEDIHAKILRKIDTLQQQTDLKRTEGKV
jgi:arginine decarboxylase-like protein